MVADALARLVWLSLDCIASRGIVRGGLVGCAEWFDSTRPADALQAP